MTKKNLPFLLQKSVEQVPDFIEHIRKAREGFVRAMRKERRESFAIFLPVLLLGVSLQHEGAICIINGKTVRPMTVDDMAEKSGLNTSNIERMLEDLKGMGYITSKQIKRKNKVNGQLEVSPGLRFFTPKFWEDLGLKSLFEKSVLWAKKHCKRFFILPFKTIKIKTEKVFHSASEILQPVLKNLSPDALRIKKHCDEILTMLKQNKYP